MMIASGDDKRGMFLLASSFVVVLPINLGIFSQKTRLLIVVVVVPCCWLKSSSLSSSSSSLFSVLFVPSVLVVLVTIKWYCECLIERHFPQLLLSLLRYYPHYVAVGSEKFRYDVGKYQKQKSGGTCIK
jgi:hypothetical protein